jgi:hypothetical protein
MNSPKEIVLKFIECLNNENFQEARALLKDDMTFEGVMGSRNGADNYIAVMSEMKLKYHIIEVMTNDSDVALFYDISMDGIDIFSAGWYRTCDEKIRGFKVVFDPRPLLEINNK